MQYYFCPRCKFRMAAIKKHICPTCGYKIPRSARTTDSTNSDNSNQQTEHQSITPGFWSKLLRWEFSSVDADSIESTQEKPALS